MSLDIKEFAELIPEKSNAFIGVDKEKFVDNIEHVLSQGAPISLSMTSHPMDDLYDVVFSVRLGQIRPKSNRQVQEEKPEEQRNHEERLKHQLEALRWLQSRTSDQFVLAWIAMEIQSVERAGGTPERS